MNFACSSPSPASPRRAPGSIVRVAMVLATLASVFGVVASLVATTPAAGADLVLTGIKVVPEGKLVRVHVEATAPIETFTLGRQGPPERRDLVLKIRGAASGMSLQPTDTSGPSAALPFEASTLVEEGASFARVIFPRSGDALVRFERDGGRLSLLFIPQEPRAGSSIEAYRIGADDVLAISVFGHDDLTKTSKVSPEGMINFPLIGNVRAASRTVDDLAAEIQERLGKDFLVEPHVTVSVWEYLSQWVNVIGDVMKPGRYYMTGSTTLIDAISQAGGLKPASGETILVTRRAQESDPSAAGEVMRFSTASLLSVDGSAASFRLRPGDVVNVLSRGTP